MNNSFDTDVELHLERSIEFLDRAARFLNEANSSALCAGIQASHDDVLTRKVLNMQAAIKTRCAETESTKRQLVEFIERRKAEEQALDVLYPKAEVQ